MAIERIRLRRNTSMKPIVHPETEVSQIIDMNLQRNTTYDLNEVMLCSALPTGLMLQCTSAGTTASALPAEYATASRGDRINDGSTIWKVVSRVGGSGGGDFSFSPVIKVTPWFSDTGITVTVSNGVDDIEGDEEDGVWTFNIPAFGNWNVTMTKGANSCTKTLDISEIKVYDIHMFWCYVFGYQIIDGEADCSARVEYMYDSIGKTPAKMDYAAGLFDYGDWGDAWFVTGNKPCMLKSDGTVDYYMNPNDYDYREDGTGSDVSNDSYDGNAMASFPLVWVKRWEEGNTKNVILASKQINSSFNAYAHTAHDGTIKDNFYYSMFGGSGNSTKVRSLAGKTRFGSMTAQQEVNGATANGLDWYTHTQTQVALIIDELVLMGKSTDTQVVYGNGNCRSASSASGILQTGTLKGMGQFYGYNSDYTHQVKVFHVEAFWGDMWDRVAGLITNNYRVYVKPTPEDPGYRVSDTTGYTDTEISVPSLSASYIKSCRLTEYGYIPSAGGGSATTYYPDQAWSATGLLYLLRGAGAHNASSVGGAFTFYVYDAPSGATWTVGAGLSYV